MVASQKSILVLSKPRTFSPSSPQAAASPVAVKVVRAAVSQPHAFSNIPGREAIPRSPSARKINEPPYAAAVSVWAAQAPNVKLSPLSFSPFSAALSSRRNAAVLRPPFNRDGVV